MNYTAKYFSENLPEWKRKKDPILSQLFYRRASFFVSAFFANLGVGANAVSLISIGIAFLACAAFVAGWPIVGALLVNIWLIFDCADGNIARAVKKEAYGDFVDSMSSYICVGLLFPCLAFVVFRTGGLMFQQGDGVIMLLGAFASGCDSLSRLIYQKYLNSSFTQGRNERLKEDGSDGNTIDKLRVKVDQFVSLGGILPVTILICSIFKWLDVVVVAWFAYYALVFLGTVAYLSLKVIKTNSSAEQSARK